MFRTFIVALFALFFFNRANSQTLIINEVSQGVFGNMEWVELVVVDTTVVYNCSNSNPPCIDIRGWIFDDNSGYHGPAGIAAGAIRFSNDPMWACVPLGTIILIYNSAQIDPSIPAADVSLADGNCRIVAPVDNPSLFESNPTTPGAIACSYPATGWVPGGNWNNTLLANTGDCARIVNLAGCEVFSVCYGSANQNTSIYFANGAELANDHRNTVYYFNNGNPLIQANWSIGCTDNETILDANQCGANIQTPGSPNNAANANFINQFNNNCQPITPISSAASVISNEICACDGAASVIATGSIPGYTYSWYNSSFNSIGQNSSNATGLCTGTYYVVTTSAIGCSDTSSVVINSGTSITMTDITDQSYCNGDTSQFIQFNGAPNGTVYNWVNSNSSIGLSASGTGNILPFALNNSGNSSQIATLTVTPTLNGCSGTPITFTITVRPTPDVSVPANIQSCPGEIINTQDFNSTSSGTLFTWTNSNTDIGLAAAGNNQIPSFTTSANNTGANQIGIIEVTPELNGCVGTIQSFSITISPTPVAEQPLDITVCSQDVIEPQPFILSPNGATVSWTNSNSQIGIPLSGNGPIGNFTAPINNSNNALVSVITLIPQLNGCNGNAVTFQITILPQPNYTIASQNPSSCLIPDGQITLTGLQPSASFTLNYTFNGVTQTISGNTTSTGEIILPNLESGTYSEIGLTVNGCTTPSDTSIVIVNPDAPIINDFPDTISCGSLILEPISGNNLSGSESYYTGTQGTGNTLSAGTSVNASQLLFVYDENLGCTTEQSFQVTINPIPPAPLANADTIACVTSGNVTLSALALTDTVFWYSSMDPMLMVHQGNTYSPTVQNGIFTFYITQLENGCQSIPDTIQLSFVDCQITIPTAFTPDNDYANDFWIIPSIDEVFPNNQVFIYNRWGNLLYTSEKGNYNLNPWDGKFNDIPMPVGSYYFLIDTGDSNIEKIKGIVSIILKDGE